MREAAPRAVGNGKPANDEPMDVDDDDDDDDDDDPSTLNTLSQGDPDILSVGQQIRRKR